MQKNDKILNRYKVLDTIGSGGMGKVLKVFDEEAKKIVALKVLSDVRADAVEYFKREFRTLAKLQHPNLVEVYEFGTLEDGCSYFTMEFVRDWISGSMSVDDIVVVGPQIKWCCIRSSFRYVWRWTTFILGGWCMEISSQATF